MIVDKTEEIRLKNQMKQELYDVQMESETDPMTKLLNRFGVEKYIKQSLQKEPKTGMMFMFDLDNFKRINDEQGHPKGDEVLKIFANCLKEYFRKQDMIGRMGGDEFVVFLETEIPRANLEGKLQKLLEKIREELKEYYEEYGVSTSIGVAYASEQIGTYEELYEYTDVALYIAKRLGKDRYYINEWNIRCMRNECLNCTKGCKKREILNL